MTQYRIPVQVNVFPYRVLNVQIEFLLMRRLPHGGGFWQGVSGGVLLGEALTLAAMRELLEEAGFEAAVQSVDYTYSYPVEENNISKYAPDVEEVVEHAYVADVTDLGEPTLSREHDAYKWQALSNIDMTDLHWPANQEALRRAWEFVLGHQSNCRYTHMPPSQCFKNEAAVELLSSAIGHVNSKKLSKVIRL